MGKLVYLLTNPKIILFLKFKLVILLLKKLYKCKQIFMCQGRYENIRVEWRFLEFELASGEKSEYCESRYKEQMITLYRGFLYIKVKITNIASLAFFK